MPDAVIEEVKAWQSRPLDALYPIVYLDCIHVKVRDTGTVRAKAVYLALGINIEARKSCCASGSPRPRGRSSPALLIYFWRCLSCKPFRTSVERVPFHNADAFVAFTGFDPRANDSDHKAGRRRLSKRGPAELRRLLFNAAMSAAKTEVWKPIYEHYRAQGWRTTASLVIIAREIVRAAWSIHYYRSTFNPDRITKGLT